MISAARAQRTLAEVLPPWWLMLITGIGWTLVALILLAAYVVAVWAMAGKPS